MRPDPRQGQLRRARPGDMPALAALITRSGQELSHPYYSPEQAEAVTHHLFDADSQLIADGTYYVIESDDGLLACGGWSKRRTLFGGDRSRTGEDPLLDPLSEAARIRGFFVDPPAARRGLGRRLLETCIADARAAGFGELELVSTLPGEPLYLAFGFSIVSQFDLLLPGDVRVPVSRMRLSAL